jgi:DNA-binding NtrC family response regulator
MSAKLLIVDDEPMILKATARALKSFGWNVITSEVPHSPSSLGADIVLTDWRPYGPRMLELSKHDNIPVVVFTSDDTGIPKSVLVLPKPISVEELSVALNMTLEERAARP